LVGSEIHNFLWKPRFTIRNSPFLWKPKVYYVFTEAHITGHYPVPAEFACFQIHTLFNLQFTPEALKVVPSL
jgi:hypothetical protein